MTKIRILLNITIESRDLDEIARELAALPFVMDLYEITGESDIVLVLEAENVIDFRNMLKNQILCVKGVKTTVSSVVMYVHKRDGKRVD
ncbi:MAG: Lrp/AsnC ligand binding domain-containing protein [Candidatus Thorarchaeota archaeon]